MASETNLPKMFEAFKVAFEALAKDKSFQYLQQVINQNNKLVEQNASLKTINQGNMDNIADLQILVRETKKAVEDSRNDLQLCKKEVETLTDSQSKSKSKVEQLDKKVKESNERVTDAERKKNLYLDRITQLEQASNLEKEKLNEATTAQKHLKSGLETATQRLAETKAFLKGYESLTQEVVDLEQDLVTGTLEAITSSMRKLLVTFLNTELSADALSRVCKLTNKYSNIPMLNSNSADARQMRIAAAMFFAAQALEEHIFQSTYLFKGNILCQLLSDVAETDPVREAHIRAVLLPVKTPKDAIQGRLRQCVPQIESIVGLMVAENRQDEFSTALGQVCESICKHWMKLQRVKGSIEAKLDLRDSFDEEDYKLLTSLMQEDLDKVPRSSEPSTRSSNGQSAAKKGPHSVDLEHAGPVVWPTFIWKSPDRERVICLQNCIVLSRSQVENVRDRSHREWRMQRRESTSSNKPDDKGGKDFLSGGSAKKPNPG